MSEMLERAARAIFNAPNGIDGDPIGVMLFAGDPVGASTPDEAKERTLAVCRLAARAAIEAMKYQDADESSLIKVSNAERVEAVTLSLAWDAMIDEALK